MTANLVGACVDNCLTGRDRSRRNRLALCRFVAAFSLAATCAAAAAVPTAAASGSGYGNVINPSITGDPSVGSTLTANAGTWNQTGTGPVTYTFQWEHCDPTNLLSNGTFESGLTGWSPYASGSTKPALNVVTSPVHGGSNAMKVVTPGKSLLEGANLETSASSGPRYHLSGWVNAVSPTSDSNIILEFFSYSASGSWLEEDSAATQHSGTGGWTQLVGTETLPATVAGVPVARHVLHIGEASKQAATFVADDLWLNTCATIDGATGQTYVPTEADAGMKLTVDVFAHHSTGITEDYYSDETTPVAEGDPSASDQSGVTGDDSSPSPATASVVSPTGPAPTGSYTLDTWSSDASAADDGLSVVSSTSASTFALTGVVVDAATGAPVANAAVSLADGCTSGCDTSFTPPLGLLDHELNGRLRVHQHAVHRASRYIHPGGQRTWVRQLHPRERSDEQWIRVRLRDRADIDASVRRLVALDDVAELVHRGHRV